MKKLVLLAMLSPLTSFAADVAYTGEYLITYKTGNHGIIFVDHYNDNKLAPSFEVECKRAAKRESVTSNFDVLNRVKDIESITVRCIDEDFNVVKIDLTKEILNKVK